MRLSATLLLLVYVALLAPVLTDFRGVMGDEAAYVDPALRWCNGKSFTSTAWNQSPDEFWASNTPLYAMSVATWVKFTGLESLWSLRLFSLLVFAAGLGFWIAGCKRAGWLKSAAQQTGFLVLLLGSLYATAPSQYARPEAVGILLLGLSLYGQTLPSEKVRIMAAFASGFLVSWCGLQFVVALAVFASVWFLFAATKPWKVLASCAAGGALGFAILFAVYHSMGVLDVFFAATFGVKSNRWDQWHGWRDPMLWSASALLLAFALLFRPSPPERQWALAGLLAGPGLAAALFFLNKFPQYYAVLALFPLCTAVCAVFPSMPKEWKPAAFAFLASASLIGFPLAALMNWNVMPGRQHADLQQWMESALAGSKAVFVDPSAYFAARSGVREVYTQFVLEGLSREESEHIDSAVLAPAHGLPYLRKEEVLKKLGGEWQCTAVYPVTWPPHTRAPQIDFLSRLSYAAPYRFEIWRRKDQASPRPNAHLRPEG